MGEMVEAQEFPELASRYQISGVPDTIINGRERVLGAQPLPTFIEAVEKAAKGI
jgi:predicted DsbA family dithiol-disulfide isomerase